MISILAPTDRLVALCSQSSGWSRLALRTALALALGILLLPQALATTLLWASFVGTPVHTHQVFPAHIRSYTANQLQSIDVFISRLNLVFRVFMTQKKEIRPDDDDDDDDDDDGCLEKM